ncbi:hypothetical protein [Streptomyces sp. NBC_00445]|uniref:hypothetical protein n=1 Tax=Streptomyces sp. NBC_00445 TaxID=2975745 RepID=UPI003FCD9CA7
MPQLPEESRRPARGSTGHGPPAVRLLRAAASADIKPSEMSAAPAAGVEAPAKVEVIASLTGCKPKIRVEADQLREGVCRTKEAEYVITTFPEEKYTQVWLDSAAVYGGKYLVGERWVVSAKPEMLERFRDKIGGTVRELRGTGPTAGP